MRHPKTTRVTSRKPIVYKLLTRISSLLIPFKRCTHHRLSIRMERREEITFYLLISPWIIGFLVFIAGPMFSSLYLSLTDWNLFESPKWVGLDNYQTMLFHDPLFWHSLKVTLLYTVGTVVLGTIGSLFLALLFNQPIRGVNIYRAIFFLPSVVSGVTVAHLWRIVLQSKFGILNMGLRLFGIQGPGWLSDPRWAIISLIMVSLWSIGGGALIFVAGLQSISHQLYEAAEIDGAGLWAKFWNITLPMLSPVILFSLIVNTIDSFQVFTLALVLTRGGPANATQFYGLYLYQNAFQFFKMGYASSMAWILLIIMLIITIVQLKVAPRWVYYEAE